MSAAKHPLVRGSGAAFTPARACRAQGRPVRLIPARGCNVWALSALQTTEGLHDLVKVQRAFMGVNTTTDPPSRADSEHEARMMTTDSKPDNVTDIEDAEMVRWLTD